MTRPNINSDLEAITVALSDPRIRRIARKISFVEDEILHELELAERGELKTYDVGQIGKHALRCIGTERRHASVELRDPGWFTATFTMLQYRVELLFVGETARLYSVSSRHGDHNDGSTMPRVNMEQGELIFPRLFAWRGRNYPLWYAMARLHEVTNGCGPEDRVV